MRIEPVVLFPCVRHTVPILIIGVPGRIILVRGIGSIQVLVQIRVSVVIIVFIRIGEIVKILPIIRNIVVITIVLGFVPFLGHKGKRAQFYCQGFLPPVFIVLAVVVTVIIIVILQFINGVFYRHSYLRAVIIDRIAVLVHVIVKGRTPIPVIIIIIPIIIVGFPVIFQYKERFEGSGGRCDILCPQTEI